jgi:hypothetical protein
MRPFQLLARGRARAQVDHCIVKPRLTDAFERSVDPFGALRVVCPCVVVVQFRRGAEEEHR